MDVDAVVGDLHALGVRLGDVVMVHASLRAIGSVDGGADGVIAALDRAVGAAPREPSSATTPRVASRLVAR